MLQHACILGYIPRKESSMLETVYSYTKSQEKVVEKLVGDDQVMINHVVLAKGDALPEHYSDSNVYRLLYRGC